MSLLSLRDSNLAESLMNRYALLFSCALALPLLAPVHAEVQFEKAEDAVAYRQSALKLMGAHFGGLAPTMRGRTPYDAAAVQAEIDLVRTISALPWKAFGENAKGGNARPAIWEDSEKFRQAAENLKSSMDRLGTAAAGGDFDTVRAAYADTAATCKACHDSFRQRR